MSFAHSEPVVCPAHTDDSVGALRTVTYEPIEQTDGATVQYDIIRERVLTTGRPPEGRVVSVRLVESLDDDFSIFVRVSWRKGEYLVGHRETDTPKSYKNIDAIVRRCRTVYLYDGPISIETEQRV